jgi:ubiquinone/menaquinone biosynthesis C-methylase UbiE
MSNFPPSETAQKTIEKKFFSQYYESTDRAFHLEQSNLPAYFEAEFNRAEQLYGQCLHRPANVLSVGAGWGTISVWAKKHYPEWRIVSTDYVESSLPFHYELGRLMNTVWDGHLAVEDWDALPHAANTFDYVLADRALHHAIDPVRALKEIRRVTKPGGLFLMLREPSLPLARPEIGTQFAQHAMEQGANDHIYTVPQWIQFFHEAGWHVDPRVHLEDIRERLHGSNNPFVRRLGKWIYHRVPHHFERVLYPYIVRYGSNSVLSKLTYYARAPH